MITTNFSLRRGRSRGEEEEAEEKKILGNPDRLHKSALFKWANIIWSAALWSIIPDSYPSREGGINHREKLFSSAPPPHTHTHLLSLYITPLIPLSPCQVCFVVFCARPVKTQNNASCCNHFKWLCAPISVIGFRSSVEWGNLRAVWVVCMCRPARGGEPRSV